MSYILDALRKSEEERTKSGTPPTRSGYTFIKGTPPTKRNKFFFGLILTSFLLMIALILGAGWWWSQREQADSKGAATTVQPLATKVETSIEAAPELSPAASPPKPLPVASIPEPSQANGDSDSSSQPLLQSTAESPYLENMDPEFQQRIPQLNFSGHVYSPEPGLRMIMINDTVVREGDPVGTELTLDEITEDGVIMRFQKTIFQIKLL